MIYNWKYRYIILIGGIKMIQDGDHFCLLKAVCNSACRFVGILGVGYMRQKNGHTLKIFRGPPYFNKNDVLIINLQKISKSDKNWRGTVHFPSQDWTVSEKSCWNGHFHLQIIKMSVPRQILTDFHYFFIFVIRRTVLKKIGGPQLIPRGSIFIDHS